MGISASDFIPLSHARANFSELAEGKRLAPYDTYPAGWRGVEPLSAVLAAQDGLGILSRQRGCDRIPWSQ